VQGQRKHSAGTLVASVTSPAGNLAASITSPAARRLTLILPNVVSHRADGSLSEDSLRVGGLADLRRPTGLWAF
jgi:hypothetical protein